MKNSRASSKKLKIDIPNDPFIPLPPGYIPEGI
jgi:hypothetical protein